MGGTAGLLRTLPGWNPTKSVVGISGRNCFMSDFGTKVLSGLETNDREWTQYLVYAHSVAPGMSSKAFSSYEVSSGMNSYEKLASILDSTVSPVDVLDLGCGDGELVRHCLSKNRQVKSIVGLDISSDELALAKARFQGDPRVTFRLESAQDLGLPSESIDVVLSHMALMLMLPIESVLHHIKRVLRPGGVVSAVVGHLGGARGVLKKFQSVVEGFFEAEFPKMSHPRTGDSRMRSRDTLESLWVQDAGFGAIQKIEDFDLQIRTDVEGVWNFWRHTYLVGMLPPDHKTALRGQITSAALRLADRDGNVEFEFPMRQVTAMK